MDMKGKPLLGALLLVHILVHPFVHPLPAPGSAPQLLRESAPAPPVRLQVGSNSLCPAYAGQRAVLAAPVPASSAPAQWQELALLPPAPVFSFTIRTYPSRAPPLK